MIVSFPTPLGPEMMTSMRARGALHGPLRPPGATSSIGPPVTGPHSRAEAVQDALQVRWAAARSPGSDARRSAS